MALTNKMLRPTVGHRRGIAAGTPMESAPEAAAQTFKEFAPVILTSGTIVESTSPISSTNKLIGFATGPASGVTARACTYVEATADVEFEFTLSNATAGTATLAQTDVGLIYPITKDTATGNWYLDKNATSTDGGLITRLKDPVGTVDGRVFVAITRPAVLGA
jgi:hypothetical protein